MSFLPDPAVLAAFTLASLVLIASPGPDMTLYLGKTIRYGRLAGAVSVLGAICGIIVHSILAAVGLSALLAASEAWFLALKIAGALYLLWLAFQTIRNGTDFQADKPQSGTARLTRIWLQGVAINLLNPKIVLFFVTFLPQFVSVSDPVATGKLLFLGLFFVAIALPCCLAMVAGADRLTHFMKSSPRALRALDWIFAGLMGGFALKLLSSRA